MKDFKHEQTINGTFGECWMDDDYMAQAIALEAKLKLETVEVPKNRTLKKGYKVVGITGDGTVKLNKVTSYFTKKVLGNLKAGKATRITLISNLEDPEALGAERVRLNDCVLTELTLANWENGKILEEEMPFQFSDGDLLDEIEEEE